MKTAKVHRSRSLRFVITPMIDIVFLLIIFFLVATHFVKSETQETVDLPAATQATNEEEIAARRIIITITDQDKYLVGGRFLTWPELEGIILETEDQSGKPNKDQQREVRIRGDASSQYHLVKPILMACAQAGIKKVSFAVVPVDKKKP